MTIQFDRVFQRQPHYGARALLVLLVLYVFAFLPLAGVLAYLEGAARDMWSLSAHDFSYQLGAYLAFWGMWLLLSSPLVIGLFYFGLDWIIEHDRSSWLAAPLACVALLLGSAAVGLLLVAVTGGDWRGAFMLLLFPFGVFSAAAGFGVVSYHLLRFFGLLPGVA